MIASLISLSALTALAAGTDVRVGPAAYGDWRTDAPGVVRKLSPDDLPPPGATPFYNRDATPAPRPEGASLKTLPGFEAKPFATLEGPRQIRVAPNGDIFVAESLAGRITVLRARDGASAPEKTEVFADGLDRPHGIAFYPAVNPKWVYVAATNQVVRYPYQSGDLKARGPAEVIIAKLVEKKQGHWTRDLAFSADGKQLLIASGSGSNMAEQVAKQTPEETAAFIASHAKGAMWGLELNRADVLVAAPDGSGLHPYATGLRNCVGMAIQPRTGTVWCGVNERDLLGDNLPPDYVTRVKPGAFYGWPWYYIGAHEDPRPHLKGQRPDLADQVTVPDVLIQPHSAPLGLAFYEGGKGPGAFPDAYKGQLFATLHGSWNRQMRTGYKIVRMVLKDGVPTGEYQDFVTGFVIDEKTVWGRPVGVAFAHDGSMLMTDDAQNTVWRISYTGKTR